MSADRINDGGAAFPQSSDEWDSDSDRFRPCSVGGMSLRDYFAAKAMQGALANVDARKTYSTETDAGLARKCYDMADAMLKARQS